MNTIQLTARITDPLHFIFCPDTWEKELKPVSKAKWTHDSNAVYSRHNYTLKEGAFLAFPQFNMTSGGFYAAHIYAVAKEMDCPQVRATLTHEGLTLESIGSEIKTRVTITPRGLQRTDTPYHAILN